MEIGFCDVSKISQNKIEKYYNFICEINKNKVQNYKNDLDKKCTIIGEILARKMISKKINIDFKEIEIFYTNNGKPYCKINNIKFNISHCDNIVVCVISNKEVGIDVEKIKPVNMGMVNNFCNKEEKEYIFNHNPIKEELKYCEDKEILTRFFKIWTGKEAYIKCNDLMLCQINKIHPKKVIYHDINNKYIVAIYEN